MKAPRYTIEIAPERSSTAAVLVIACQLAERYRDRIPTAKQLQEQFGMSQATSYRWRHAMRHARGQL